jgi:hypothetical protein
MNNTRYVRCIKNDDYEIDLTVGQVYKALPLTDVEKDTGVIRVIDNEGEDYLYDTSYFEPFQPDGVASELTDSLTVHLDAFTKGILHAEALAANKTMSALVREWINERLCSVHSNKQDTRQDSRTIVAEEYP